MLLVVNVGYHNTQLKSYLLTVWNGLSVEICVGGLNNVKIEHRINPLSPKSGQFRHNLVTIIKENPASVKENPIRLNIVCKSIAKEVSRKMVTP